jgi:hypothetical protein
MSKRFTHTEKWDRPWFRKLPLKYKLLWLYLCDKCDIGGCWYVDMDIASFSIGEKISEEEAVCALEKQIKILDGGKYWVVTDFVKFQYGTVSTTNNFHKAIQKKLSFIDEKAGASQPQARGWSAPMVKVKVKDKVKIEDNKDTISNKLNHFITREETKISRFKVPSVEDIASYCKDRGNGVNPSIFFDFYESKGWKVGNQSMKDWKASVRIWERRETGAKRSELPDSLRHLVDK